jgi:type IV pilus assembly protein PilY1
MRRTRTQRFVATVAGLVGALASSAHAQSGEAIDVRAVKPIVMLLVDTSGSMERMPDESVGTGYPKCTGNPASHDDRNRWAVTLEALTGTFNDFSCVREERSSYARSEYDYGYHLPHHRIQYTSQASNGLLDNFLYRLKFGLMTFDGVGTTLHGDTLVPYARWKPSDSFWDEAYGPPGMYSYGRVGRLSFPNCVDDYGINAGARGPGDHAGALISPGLVDDGPSVLAVNERIQNSLLAVRPFGGTPIAAMLDDLEYFLRHDPAVKQGPDGDPYYECRDRYAVLLTDGEPDALFRDVRFKCDTPGGGLDGAPCAPVTGSGDSTPKCECPYPTEVELAARMRAEETLTKLFVIAFNVEGAAALATLDQIAQAGGERDAYRTSEQEDLRTVLDDIFANVQRGATSRSVPQVVEDGLATFLGGNQYEITAGFRVGDHANDPWQGFLYRQRIGCQDNQPTAFPFDADEDDMFHERLNAQAKVGRKIVTVLPEPISGVNGTIVSNYYTAPEAYTRPRYNRVLPNNTEISATAPVLETPSSADAEPVDFTDSGAKPVPLGLFGPSSDPEALRTKVVQYVRGNSTDPADKRKDKVLADIYHSNPVVLPPLVKGSRYLDTEEEELSAALLTLISGDAYGTDGRPGVVFVGTNDGVLHAFNLEAWTAADGQVFRAGHEFWGFVPPSLFNKFSAAALPTHVEMFDGTPQVRNMMLYRDPETRAGVFRTVLVSAVRGAPSFVALDVTHPEQPPVFLWQFSAPNMGLTVGTPALAQALIKWSSGSGEGDDGVVERAIAILPGGAGSQKEPQPAGGCALTPGVTQPAFPKGSSAVRSNVRCWKETGRGLYVVDVATGELLQEFDHHHFPSPLTGAVAVDGSGLDVSKAAYFTDQDGVLWRLSMVDPDPSHWKVAPLFDLFHSDKSPNAYKNGRPSSYPPLLSRDPQGNNVIIVGTGDIDNLVDTTAHRVVSLRERRALEETPLGLNFGGDTDALDINWEQQLEPGESVTGPLSLFDSVVYFGTFVSPQGASVCDLGQSRLWGLHYLEADKPQSEGDEEGETPPAVAGTPAPRPMLVKDPSADEPEYVRYIETDDLRNSLLLGVNIAPEPLCVPGGLEVDPFAPNISRFQPTGQMTGGNYQLRAMVGGHGGSKVENSQLSQFQRTLPVRTESRMVGWGGLIE